LVVAIHGLNERLAASYAARNGGEAPRWFRFSVTVALLIVSVFVAGRFGFVELVARGYSWLAVAILLIYVAPLMTYGVWLVWRRRAFGSKSSESAAAPSADVTVRKT